MIANSAVQPNPALGELEVLLGYWMMEISNAHFLPSLSDTAKGHVSLEWVQDGAYLAMRMGAESISHPAATWLIGRDESAPNYKEAP
jgi:hypothetical protein